MTPITCWNCGRQGASLHFCEGCGSIQPPAGDYFEYLGLPRKLQIDLLELGKNFYVLSRRLHPDVYFQRPERERLLAEEASARLNDAYRTLQDPVARAEYLLELYGMHKRDQNAPAELLEEVFELQSALEAGDSSASARSRFEAMLGKAGQSLECGFREWDRTGQREALERIADILNRRSYILKASRGAGFSLRRALARPHRA